MKNGTRQPQAYIACSDSVCCSTISTTSASSWPRTMETYWKLEKKPRLPGVATSDR